MLFIIQNPFFNFLAKVGKCPKPLPPFFCSGGEENMCIDDSDCFGSKKCCSQGCFKQCTFPLLSMFLELF